MGRYALCEELACGGMASVSLGRLVGDAGFSRTVAVKKLHAQFAAEEDFVSMMLDEARLASRIQHPNVVAVRDVVVQSNELYLVMDYVHGESLAELLRAARRRRETPPVDVAVAILIDALCGLAAAHEAVDERGRPLDIIHRDVSPQNLLVDAGGHGRVVDFGVAKAAGCLHHTETGQLKGKVAYMAPEQLRMEPIDQRLDVYAAGVVAWELLSGQRLFHAPDPGSIVWKVLQQEVPPPSRHTGQIPPALDAVVLRALYRHPNGRFPTAAAFAAALERVVAPAPRAAVVAWMEGLVGDRLASKSALVRQVEGRHFVGEATAAGFVIRESLRSLPPPTVALARVQSGFPAREANTAGATPGARARAPVTTAGDDYEDVSFASLEPLSYTRRFGSDTTPSAEFSEIVSGAGPVVANSAPALPGRTPANGRRWAIAGGLAAAAALLLVVGVTRRPTHTTAAAHDEPVESDTSAAQRATPPTPSSAPVQADAEPRPEAPPTQPATEPPPPRRAAATSSVARPPSRRRAPSGAVPAASRRPARPATRARPTTPAKNAGSPFDGLTRY